MAAGYDMNDLDEQAGRRWLKSAEVLFILQNHDSNRISHRVHHKPTSGSLFLFDKNVLASFRGDGHIWKKYKVKRKDKEVSKKAKEAHVQLKVDQVPVLNCYYAQGEDNPRFKRRCYWMLDGANKHIVLVHYIDEGETNPASASGQSYTFIHSDKVFPFPLENQGSAYFNQSLCSLVAEQQGMDHVNDLDGSGRFITSPEVDWQGVLDEQCRLNYDIAFDNQNQDTNGTANSALLGCDNGEKELDQLIQLLSDYDRDDGMLSDSTVPATLEEIGSLSVLQEAEIFDWPAFLETTDMDMDTYMPDTGQLLDHKLNRSKISPEWGFSDEATKVIIVGSFPCDPSKTDWACTFGDTEVPIQIIQEGVICCEAPPNHSAGKVTLCITTRNQESCSEVKEFEYRDRNSACNNCITAKQEKYRSMEEARLFARFVQILLSNSSLQKEDRNSFNIHPSSVDNSTDQVLQELLENKLKQWLSTRLLEGGIDLNYILPKKERGIIHIAAALGCDWALNPILVSGVGVNFRDTKGWTALHWAAQFGREKMVAALIKSGACPRAVTDPTAQEPRGRNPASIADANGHKGLAGYLSELEVTTHLSSLTLEEADSVDLEAVDLDNISKTYVASGDDQDSMKQVLAAGRNTVRAATLVQNVFRAHSFRKRHQREAASHNSVDEDGFTPDVIQSLSSASRYGKGRKGSFKLRRKVVKIQPRINGNRVRKYYEVTWAVGIFEKYVLRWYRKGPGLRGYKPKREVIEENEDILKEFRKEMVDTNMNEATSRVQFMIHCPEAQKQYTRMLETSQQAKDIPSVLTIEEDVDSLADVVFTDIDTEDALMQLPLEPPTDCFDYSEIWPQSVC